MLMQPALDNLEQLLDQESRSSARLKELEVRLVTEQEARTADAKALAQAKVRAHSRAACSL